MDGITIAMRFAPALLALALAACVAAPPKAEPVEPAPPAAPAEPPTPAVKPLATVSGFVTYRLRTSLTPDVSVTVRLADVSRVDAPEKVLAEQVITNPGQVPIPFELSYDPDDILPDHSYAVQARIEREGRLLFINNARHCVITQGCPTALEVQLVPVRHY
jgi:putative lipoprotein